METLGLDLTALVGPAPQGRMVRQVDQRYTAQMARAVSTLDLINMEGTSILPCKCGAASSWLSTGTVTFAVQRPDLVADGSGSCSSCRETLCGRSSCLHCSHCGIGVTLSTLFFTPNRTIVCLGCARWIEDRWPHTLMWNSKSAQSLQMDMVLRACRHHLDENESVLGLGQRITWGLQNTWTAFFPLKREARKGGSFDWGWLWVLVWEILQAAEVNLKHTLTGLVHGG